METKEKFGTNQTAHAEKQYICHYLITLIYCICIPEYNIISLPYRDGGLNNLLWMLLSYQTQIAPMRAVLAQVSHAEALD
jgi:hypothetical protein